MRSTAGFCASIGLPSGPSSRPGKKRASPALWRHGDRRAAALRVCVTFEIDLGRHERVIDHHGKVLGHGDKRLRRVGRLVLAVGRQDLGRARLCGVVWR